MTRLVMTLLLAASVLFIAACGGGSVASNEYLGKAPGLAAKYEQDIEALEEKADKATSMEKAFKYAKEAENLEDEADEEFEELNNNSTWEPLPFDVSENLQYEVKEIRVKGVNGGRLQLEMDVMFAETPKNKYGGGLGDFFGYLQPFDADGKTIEGHAVLMYDVPYGEAVEGEKLYTLTGTYSRLSNLLDFAKFKVVTREEYKG